MVKKTILLVAFVASGCTVTRVARLYDLENATILQATYKANGSGHGPIWIGNANVPDCTGEYVTIAAGDSSWGAIFSGGRIAQVITASTDNEQRGRAIATCGDGRIIECEYITGSTAGHGQCQDNQSHRYRLMF